MKLTGLLTSLRRLGAWVGVVTASVVVLRIFGETVMAADRPVQAPTEYETKAGFLVLFALHTTWQEERFSSPTAPLVIGVYGEDPFNGALEKVISRQVGLPRPMEVRRVKTVSEAMKCHVVFVPVDEQAMEAERYQSLKDESVLLVGESAGTIEAGGALVFKVVDKKVRYEASWLAFQRARLRASSGLFAAALRVHGKEEDKNHE